MELNYVLLKSNRVVNVIVVSEQNDKEIKSYCDLNGYDEFIFTGEETLPMHSLRIGSDFVTGDFDYLKSIGLSQPDNSEQAIYTADEAKLLLS